MRWKVQDALGGCAVDTEDCTSYFDPSAHLPIQVHSPLSVSCSALQKPDFYALHLVGSLAHCSVGFQQWKHGQDLKVKRGKADSFLHSPPPLHIWGWLCSIHGMCQIVFTAWFQLSLGLRNTVSSPSSLRIMSVKGFLLFPTPGYLSIHYNH